MARFLIYLKCLVYAATTSPPTYHKSIGDKSSEPFYEIPKFNDSNDVTTTNTASSLSEGDPKSSASNSSKYSSSGYVGSELWDPDYFTSLSSTPAAATPKRIGNVADNITATHTPCIAARNLEISANCQRVCYRTLRYHCHA